MQEEMKTLEALFEDLEKDTQAKVDQIQALEAENEQMSRQLAAQTTPSGQGGSGAGDGEEVEELMRALEERQKEADEYALRYAEMIQSTQSYEKKVKNLESRLKRAERQLEAEKEKSRALSSKPSSSSECEEPKRSTTITSPSSSSSSSSLSTAKRPRDTAEPLAATAAPKESTSAAASQVKRLRLTAGAEASAPATREESAPRSRPGLAAAQQQHCFKEAASSSASGAKRKERIEAAEEGEDKENLPMAANAVRSRNALAPSSSSSSSSTAVKAQPPSKKSRKSVSQTKAGGAADSEGDCPVQ